MFGSIAIAVVFKLRKNKKRKLLKSDIEVDKAGKYISVKIIDVDANMSSKLNDNTGVFNSKYGDTTIK